MLIRICKYLKIKKEKALLRKESANSGSQEQKS